MSVLQYKKKLEITAHEDWAKRFWADLVPWKDKVVQHQLLLEMSEGSLSLERFRRALLNFYPLVENFPKYMALNLSKVRPGVYPGHEEAKNWMIDNIKVEQRHAYWYKDWAKGFGISSEALDHARPRAGSDAVNNYLWNVDTNGLLCEGIAATNLAIEWATGEWTQNVVRGMEVYAARGEAEINRHSMAWLRAHASYDDAHPHEAMELIKRLCVTTEDQEKALFAARRGLEYYVMALDDCYNG
jgi:pyrroloquinoline quinone (PQQ) biosynthesis protein C